MEADVSIREARAEDSDRIAVLCGQLGYPVTMAEIGERLGSQTVRHGSGVVYVADLPDRPVAGWVQAFVREILLVDRNAELGGLVVDEEQRGLGIGRALMEAVEEWARAQGCKSVWVRSNVIREGAHRFYRHIGYEIVKTQVTFRKAL
jgi:GNAT superfamily N-acetyltransferase